MNQTPGTTTDPQTLPVAATRQPRPLRWRPTRRCTLLRCLRLAQCQPRTHTHTHTRVLPPLPPHTHLLHRRPATPRHPAPPYRPTARTPSVPAPPYGATSPRQSHRLRRPSTAAVFPRASSPRSTMGAPHHGCTPTDSLPRPPRRPPSLPVGTRRSITRPSLPTHIPPVSPLCATPLSSEGG